MAGCDAKLNIQRDAGEVAAGKSDSWNPVWSGTRFCSLVILQKDADGPLRDKVRTKNMDFVVVNESWNPFCDLAAHGGAPDIFPVLQVPAAHPSLRGNAEGGQGSGRDQH
jgi:hypothetical protein